MSNDSSHGIEKYDAPENYNKYEQDDVIINPVSGDSHFQYTRITTTMPDEAFTMNSSGSGSTSSMIPKMANVPCGQSSLSFTIDNTTSDTDVQQARYKQMMERFENRHKRGASLSKLDVKPTTVTTNAPSNLSATREVRLRDRSAPRKDMGQRRSWSPRAFEAKVQSNKWKCATKPMPMPTPMPPPSKAFMPIRKNCTDEKKAQRKFVPRSTAMQKAFYEVSNAPLEDDFKQLNMQSGDNVSESGTYVLDGDNYTEEQKALMNIDTAISPLYDYSILPSSASISPSPKSLPSPTLFNLYGKASPDFGTAASMSNKGILDRGKRTKARVNTNNKFAKTKKNLADFMKSAPNQTNLCKLTDAQLLGSVPKKADWVQEWARNARARSLANETVTKTQTNSKTRQNAMTRSTEHGICSDRVINTSSISLYKNPRSTTLIPSPVHSTRRARSSTRLNNLLDSGSGNNSPVQTAHAYSLPMQTGGLMCTSLTGYVNDKLGASRARLNSYDGNVPNGAGSHFSVPPRSTSNTNFSHMLDYFDDALHYYVQQADVDSQQSSASPMEDLSLSEDPVIASHYGKQQQNLRGATSAPPISQGRMNKTLLLRMEASRTLLKEQQLNGSAGCPNTPELRRRNDKYKKLPLSTKAKTQVRQSEPRDTREMKVPRSLSVAKKELKTAAQSLPTAQQINNLKPKYMDISKYKPQQANQFLRKNEAKITLKTISNMNVNVNVNSMRRSPSASGLSRSESTRLTSGGNVRAMPNCMTSSGTSFPARNHQMTNSLMQTRETNVASQKELDLALWKRRATYNPMRAAAEDKKRKEEMKQQRQPKNDADEDIDTLN